MSFCAEFRRVSVVSFGEFRRVSASFGEFRRVSVSFDEFRVVFAWKEWRGRDLRQMDSRVFLVAANLTLESVWHESHSGVLHCGQRWTRELEESDQVAFRILGVRLPGSNATNAILQR
ncbi:hypothetical protein PoB_006053000 [Plakobranchus ocellatus]|uniref:Uncharacterized protein n=1 Tax=Plakobranchus ocellatus TaxID=259542 RepID=A0AAV4CQA6_9GAST|nr:hypothetical protein PoB_006053000 [Plakobranchus ocellatus]